MGHIKFVLAPVVGGYDAVLKMPASEVIAFYYEQMKRQIRSNIEAEQRARYPLFPHTENKSGLELKMPVFPDEVTDLDEDDITDPRDLFNSDGSLKQPV